MRRLLCLAIFLLVVSRSPAWATTDFTVLTYHDIVDDANALTYDGITTRALAMHFDWLRANGYRVVSMDDILAAQRSERALPPRAVLLTFDDGYRSFYTRAFPLLLAFNYPAVLSVIGNLLEVPPRAQVRFGAELVAREDFVSWAQLREVQASGLVEIGSHTYGLHTTVYANPQGGEVPAATGRVFIRRTPGAHTRIPREMLVDRPRLGDVSWVLRSPFAPFLELSFRLAEAAADYAYDPATGRYEADAEYAERIRRDLERSSTLLATQLGRRPRIITWPFGRWNEVTLEVARQVGLPVSLTLDPERADVREIGRIGRFYAADNPDLVLLARILTLPLDPPFLRGLCVNLDEVYAPTEEEREQRLGKILDVLVEFKPDMVLLSAASTEGSPPAVYFPSEGIGIRANLFSRVAWQIRTRVGVEVHAWLPIERVGSDPAALRAVYAELGKSVPFAGLGLGSRFLAGDLAPVPLEGGLDRWDPRIPRWVRAGQEPARLPASTRLGLAAIQAVARYQPTVKILDVVSLDRLRPPSQVNADAVEYLAVSWDGRGAEAVRTLRQLGWLDSAYRARLVPISTQQSPREWRRLQQAGLVSGIYCPERLLDQPSTLSALREVLSASTNPFRR